MKTIGVRELRQHASRWLRRVAEGETYEITVRGLWHV
ncbi:MAG: type II toxin-antitoxin system prevent-host-death family antitoxin [Acidimicrobiaceae bacterium]|nr:type II toxin-antitoxin system prevent-host-death family antitoxin [Acidimicrobiaceae bacterium]